MNGRSTSKSPGRRFEQLESRQLLTAIPWNDGSGISLSFAPDGVDIAGETNRLEQKMDSEFPNEDWQATILQAFQKWAANANTNVSLVEEYEALPFGADGARSHDFRFGDVRIGARPLSSDILALSIPNDSPLSGTWSGDVIFNSSASFGSLDRLLSVALHEAGHVFGLENSDAVDSAMNSRSELNIISPSSEDLNELQKLYNHRLPDENDFWQSNNSMNQATLVDASFDPDFGVFPYYLFGDIAENDTDYFELILPESYSGPITVEVLTEGISLLAPEITVYDRQGRIISRETSHSKRGDSIEFEVTPQPHQDTLFLRIGSAANDEFGIGSYVTTVFFDTVNSIPEDDFDHIEDLFPFIDAADAEHFFEDEMLGFFDDDQAFFDDVHPFDPAIGLDGFDQYYGLGFFDLAGGIEEFSLVGSYSDLMDYDFFEIPFPFESNDEQTVHVSIRALEVNGVAPEISLMDYFGRPIAAEQLINEDSERLIQLTTSQLDSGVLVQVTPPTNVNTMTRQGNYELTVRFPKEAIQLDDFADGQLTSTAPTASHEFQVSVSEFDHFGLTVTENASAAGILAKVVDSKGRVIRSFQADSGKTATVSGMFLAPGNYSVQLEPLSQSIDRVPYTLTRTIVSDPFGLTPVQPDDLDFSCPDVDDVFCYPGGIKSPEKGLWDDFLDQLSDVPDLKPAEQIVALLGEWWNWYWNRTNSDSNSPPLAIKDTFQSDSGTKLTINAANGVLKNDVDPNQNNLTASLVENVSYGRLELRSDGGFDYLPNPLFVGTDTFTYKITDGEHTSPLATATIEVSVPVAAGDFDADGQISAHDIDAVAAGIRIGTDSKFDLDQSGTLDRGDVDHMVYVIANSTYGDANLDGRFDSRDLIFMFQSGKFENSLADAAGWADGDMDGDGRFSTKDLVLIFQSGVYQA